MSESPKRDGPGRPSTGARERLLDACLELLKRDGYAKLTTARVADVAGANKALISYYFGSKEGLQDACDDYVVRTVTAELEPWADRPGELAARPAAFTQVFAGAGDLVGYLGRALVETGDRTDALVDRLVDAAESFLAEGERQGTIRPSGDRRALAAVMVVWDLASIVLGAHLARALGESDQQDVIDRYARVALETFSHGFIEEEEET